MRLINRRELLVGALGVLAGATTRIRGAAAGPVTTDQYGDQNQTLPRRELPEFARARGPKVADLYRFAVNQGRDLVYIPCYCGCGNIGHTSNRTCYITSENRDGTVTFTSHAAT
jgi:hypothetical protein